MLGGLGSATWPAAMQICVGYLPLVMQVPPLEVYAMGYAYAWPSYCGKCVDVAMVVVSAKQREAPFQVLHNILSQPMEQALGVMRMVLESRVGTRPCLPYWLPHAVVFLCWQSSELRNTSTK